MVDIALLSHRVIMAMLQVQELNILILCYNCSTSSGLREQIADELHGIPGVKFSRVDGETRCMHVRGRPMSNMLTITNTLDTRAVNADLVLYDRQLDTIVFFRREVSHLCAMGQLVISF